MSARADRSAHQGEAPSSRTVPHGYLAGTGASGAVLGGAVVGFVLLVGMVSFDVWPEVPRNSPLASVELNPGQRLSPAGAASGVDSAADLGSADGLLASSVPLITAGGSPAAPDPDLSGSRRGSGPPAPAGGGGGTTEGDEGRGASGAEVDETGGGAEGAGEDGNVGGDSPGIAEPASGGPPFSRPASHAGGGKGHSGGHGGGPRSGNGRSAGE